MDFELDQAQEDERPHAVNILQLASSPPSSSSLSSSSSDDLNSNRRPALLRSRRPIMPILSSSPTSVSIDSLPIPSASSNVNIITPVNDSPSSSQSPCSPPSPPPPKPIAKERKLISALTKELDHASFLSPSSNDSSPSPQLDISDFECPLCFQVYLQPVTTPCGHVFCKQCLFRAIKHASACPLCRHKMDSSTSQKYSVNIVLMNVIEKYFPKEHRERAAEEDDNQKNEQPLKPETEETRSNSPSNWGCILPSLRSTCTVLLSCGGF